MPEYLAPGVYVEEVSFRARSIEGLSTTTTGFIGPTRYGPVNITPDVITSLGEFERSYGDRQQMQFNNSSPTNNYMWHALRGFFEEGGKRAYISRAFEPLLGSVPGLSPDGTGRFTIAGAGNSIVVAARFPGYAGNMRVRFTLQLGPNILSRDANGDTVARGLLQNEIVAVQQLTSPLTSPLSATFAMADSYFNTATQQQTWRFTSPTDPDIQLARLAPNANRTQPGDSVRVITASVTVWPQDPNLPSLVYAGLALDRNHQLNGAPDSLEAEFSHTPASLSQARTVPIVVTLGTPATGLGLLRILLGANLNLKTALLNDLSADADRSIDIVLAGGNDGERPEASAYEGDAAPDSTFKTGLKQFEDLDDISIVAAPGSTYLYEGPFRDEALTIMGLLITHCEQMRYRIAVLDSGNNQSVADVRALRTKLDSSYAALYYPWVTILDPVTRQEINLPPSGFVAGIYARNDINRAVYKAPANEVVNLAISFETVLNKAQQDILNPLGVNCFRFFEGRGYRLWGARTVSSDPEWKYVNLRRYFAFLEHSIDKGTQWAVFEPNGDQLWANVRRTIEDFLLNEWQTGALLGDKPEKSYFVKCDRSTMTQNDLDNGRLVCLIGVSPLRPAEYMIFRIGQWTADHK
ncbi:MAG: phage tail sheath subtilisin-like domain-containing protein [Acidobacteriota bacterium]|nr:phage tail sheath subtilisin-like domain-containing protein [Acidobacteriota bacterium]